MTKQRRSKRKTTLKQKRSSAGKIGAAARWAGLSAAKRRAALRPAIEASATSLAPHRAELGAKGGKIGGKIGGKVRAKRMTAKQRSEASSKAASAISPGAARARALKAHETKRRKLAQAGHAHP